MDAGIDPRTGDLSGQRITTLANAVYLRLVVPLGSWWAAPTLGSRLHELQREKDVSRVRILARDYALDALKGLLSDGRASAIDVSVSSSSIGWLQLDIDVTEAGGQQQTFNHWVRVI
ncbi:phage GP46 family protein [Luteibacter aegosomatis]|uniref:phage GP46 family protein n=1 Tax=Luteibacter aegosomatis TaxID=2911537 RepID=UPI001FF83709|nr:phage GP46 family protein [Luteibacter aegosomatis]UPG87036.1 phage GP46 family protein [Luteibacter aegosomatis]